MVDLRNANPSYIPVAADFAVDEIIAQSGIGLPNNEYDNRVGGEYADIEVGGESDGGAADEGDNEAPVGDTAARAAAVTHSKDGSRLVGSSGKTGMSHGSTPPAASPAPTAAAVRQGATPPAPLQATHASPMSGRLLPAPVRGIRFAEMVNDESIAAAVEMQVAVNLEAEAADRAAAEARAARAAREPACSPKHPVGGTVQELVDTVVLRDGKSGIRGLPDYRL